MRSTPLLPLPALVAGALLAGAAQAQVGLSGNIYDGQGGPLLSGVVYHANTQIDVPAGQTLTVEAGAILKFKTGFAWELDVEGTLVVNGTSANPVIFTSILDDGAGGDTPLDGATAGASGDWAGVNVRSAGTLDAEHLELRYAGFGGSAALDVMGGAVTLRDSTIRDSNNEGISFGQMDAPATIEGCAILNCTGYAMDDVPIDVIEGIKNNTASGNGVDAIRMPGATGLVVDGDVTIGPENCLNGALLVHGVLSQDPGTTLTLKAGTVIKVQDNSSTRWRIEGTLALEGTEADPVVITSEGDDDHGGDTLGDGPTSGAPGDWTGISVDPGGALVADHAIFRYGGKTGESSSFQGITASGGAITLRHCTLRDQLRSGIDASNDSAPLVVEGCAFLDNGDWPVVDVRWENLAGFDSNTASGNAKGDYLRVAAGAITGAVSVAQRNLIHGVVVYVSQVNLEAGASMILEKGVVLKTDDNLFRVIGALDVRGTASEPVVFTSLTDDAFGGDTNGDGPSSGTPGEWPGVRFETAAEACVMEHAIVRYSGLSHAGVWARSPLTDLRSVRVEHGARDGFELDDASSAVNLVAWNNGLQGFNLDGGTFDLVHATAVGNASDGIDHGVFHTGVIRNSIAWGNGGDNFRHVSAGDLVASNGDAALAGTDGNLNADPLFVDAANGDLRLDLASPCVDAADFATALAVVKDHDENSRILPSGFVPPDADMGAFEHARFAMTVTGSTVPGATLTLDSSGPDGVIYYAFGQLDAVAFFSPYGFVTAGLATLKPLPNPFGIGVDVNIAVPDVPALYGTAFAFQGVGISPTLLLVHYTNVWRSAFETPLP